MVFHTGTAGFIAYFLCMFAQTSPVDLVPVEQAVADRGTLSVSLKVAPLDLLQDQAFEKLYRVVGSDDVFVRRAGGLRAVFRNPSYLETQGGTIALIPAGTVYCIGEVTPRVLRQLGVLVDPTDQPEEIATPESQQEKRAVALPYMESTRTIRFIDDAYYRRKRLASFVLGVALSNQSSEVHSLQTKDPPTMQ